MRRLSIMFALLLALAGCQRNRDAEAIGATPVEPPAPLEDRETIESGAGVAPEASAVVKSVETAHSIDARGFPDPAGDVFAPGDRIFAIVRVDDLDPTLPVTASWYGPTGPVGASTQPVVRNSSVITLESPATRGWPEGNYRVDIKTGERTIGTTLFLLTSEGLEQRPPSTVTGEEGEEQPDQDE